MIPSVWLLTLTVGDETSLFTFSSEYKALFTLAQWCRRRWRQHGLALADPLPGNHQYAVRTYFLRFGGRDSYELDLMLVDPDAIGEDVGPVAAPR